MVRCTSSGQVQDSGDESDFITMNGFLGLLDMTVLFQATKLHFMLNSLRYLNFKLEVINSKMAKMLATYY